MGANAVNIYLILTVNRMRVSNFYNPPGMARRKGAAQRPGGPRLSRRPHPYFGRINRLEAARAAAPGQGCGSAPAMSADEQQGVLWAAFREASEPA